MTSSTLRIQRVFAIANLLVAIVFVAAGFALPARFWGVDLPLAATVLGLTLASVLVFARPGLANKALTISSWILLAFGLLLLTIVVFSMAFLIGVHGEFGIMGVLVMCLVGALVVPYAVLYPMFGLFVFGRRAEST